MDRTDALTLSDTRMPGFDKGITEGAGCIIMLLLVGFDTAFLGTSAFIVIILRRSLTVLTSLYSAVKPPARSYSRSSSIAAILSNLSVDLSVLRGFPFLRNASVSSLFMCSRM